MDIEFRRLSRRRGVAVSVVGVMAAVNVAAVASEINGADIAPSNQQLIDVTSSPPPRSVISSPLGRRARAAGAGGGGTSPRQRGVCYCPLLSFYLNKRHINLVYCLRSSAHA